MFLISVRFWFFLSRFRYYFIEIDAISLCSVAISLTSLVSLDKE
jgi:hypothetical protein